MQSVDQVDNPTKCRLAKRFVVVNPTTLGTLMLLMRSNSHVRMRLVHIIFPHRIPLITMINLRNPFGGCTIKIQDSRIKIQDSVTGFTH